MKYIIHHVSDKERTSGKKSMAILRPKYRIVSGYDSGDTIPGLD